MKPKNKNPKLKNNQMMYNKRNIENEPIYGNVQENDLFKIPLFVLELSQKEEAATQQVLPSTSHVTNTPVYYDPEPGTTHDLTVGSLVEVTNDVSEEPLYGVIRWMGVEGKSKYVLVGVELEEEQSHLPLILTDGIHNSLRFFQCASNRALFVPLNQCQKDSRFSDATPTPVHSVREEKTFGKVRIKYITHDYKQS